MSLKLNSYFDYASIQIDGLPQGNSERTVEAWIKTAGGPQWTQSFFSYGLRDGSSAGFALMATRLSPAGNAPTPYSKPMFVAWANDVVVDANNRNLTVEDVSVSDGEWHKVTVTFDGTVISIYLDNKNIYSSTQSDYLKDFGRTLNTQGTTLYLGGAMAQDLAYGFYGEIKQVAIWNVALTQANLTPISEEGSNLIPLNYGEMPIPTSLVAYFPLNENGVDLVSGSNINIHGGASFIGYFQGSPEGDFIQGTEGSDIINGLGGNDHLFGVGGDDSYDGGEGYDTVDLSSHNASVRIKLLGSEVSVVEVDGIAHGSLKNIERVLGGQGDDIFVGDANNNTFFGLGGNDLWSEANLEEGIDYCNSVESVDLKNSKISLFVDLDAGGAFAKMNLLDYKDKTIYNPARLIDTYNITGSKYDDYLFGSAAHNALYGMDGNDVLRGGNNGDILIGGAGSDILMGDRDNDTLTGGAGKDIFVYDAFSMDGVDVITDFQRGQDKIRLMKWAFSSFEERIYASNIVNVDYDLTQVDLRTIPTDRKQLLIFNKWNHTLYYDADGDNTVPAIAMVELTGVNLLSRADFELC